MTSYRTNSTNPLPLYPVLPYLCIRAGACQSRGVVTSRVPVGINRNDASSNIGRGGYDVCPGFRPKGHSSRVRATYELPGCRAFRQPISFKMILREVDLKTIRLNDEQRGWVLAYLHTSKEYHPKDPFVTLLKALLERPEITSIHIREDQNIVRLMYEGMEG